MSDNFPLFNKNGKSLIIMETSDKALVYNESNFVREVNPISSVYDLFFTTDNIFKIDIS